MNQEQLAAYLRGWEAEMLEAMVLPSNLKAFSGLVKRGTLMFPPASAHMIKEVLSSFSSDPPADLSCFYSVSNGLIIPCMDAEDGEILQLQKLVDLSSVSLPFSFPESGQEWQSDVVFTRSVAQKCCLMSPLIDSAFYAWECRGDGSFWALFHHGSDMRYESFESFLLQETQRVLRTLLN